MDEDQEKMLVGFKGLIWNVRYLTKKCSKSFKKAQKIFSGKRVK